MSSDGTFVIGAKGMVEDVDDAACGLLGYAREELVGRHGSELIPREVQPATAASVDRMRRGEITVRAGRLKRKDGAVVGVSVRAQVLPDGRLALDVRKLAGY